MAWTTITDGSKHKRWQWDAAVPLNADLTLDAVEVPSHGRLYWLKRVSGTPGTTSMIMTSTAEVQDGDGTWHEITSPNWFAGVALATSMNSSAGVIDNAKSLIQIVWSSITFGAADGMNLPKLPVRFTLDYVRGTEASAATYDVCELIWVAE